MRFEHRRQFGWPQSVPGEIITATFKNGSQDSKAARRSMLSLMGAASLALAGVAAPPAAILAKNGASKNDRKDRRRKGKVKNKNQKQQFAGSAEDVVQLAKKYKGAKYVWGGESPKGFDCSGFTWYCYQKSAGLHIGRTQEEQWKRGNSVGKGDLKPGDLVFFKNTFERACPTLGYPSAAASSSTPRMKALGSSSPAMIRAITTITTRALGDWFRPAAPLADAGLAASDGRRR